MTPCEVSVVARLANTFSLTETTRVRLRPRTCVETMAWAASEAMTTGISQRLRSASSRRWKPSATARPSEVREPREADRRRSFNNGFVSLRASVTMFLNVSERFENVRLR